MICPECKDGFISEPTPKPLTIVYRGFSKQIGTRLCLGCTNCLYEATDPLELNVDIDAEIILFQREVNRQLSIGELL